MTIEPSGTARELTRREEARRMARAQMEMGGKNPTIVLADADFASACAGASRMAPKVSSLFG